MGKQTLCGAKTKKGTRCTRLAMVGYSRCQLHRGEWNKRQTKKAKKR
ncbi:HGGxSTG domain-containing protein [Streptomyces sp. OE57]